MILKLFWSLAFIGILITSAEATPFRPKRVKRTFKTHRPIYKLRLVGKIKPKKTHTFVVAKKPRYNNRVKF